MRPWQINRSLTTTRTQPTAAAARVRAFDAAKLGEGIAERGGERGNGPERRPKRGRPNEGLAANHEEAVGAHPTDTDRKQNPFTPITFPLTPDQGATGADKSHPSASARRRVPTSNAGDARRQRDEIT